MTISFAVQGDPMNRVEWLALARRAEELGFEALATADHPGTTPSPIVALAAAAQVTTKLQLVPAVINAGAWDPFALASEIATLDTLSDGRAILGIGAGHTPQEWTQVGREYPSPASRVGHLRSVVAAVRRILAGEIVTTNDGSIHLRNAQMQWWTPRALPVLVGGNGHEVVRIAAAHADFLELTGLGRTLPDGHVHEPLWASKHVDARMQTLHSCGDRALRLGTLVQNVTITPDRHDAATEYRTLLASVLPEASLPSINELLDSPFVLFGTEDQITAQLRTQQQRWGFSRYTIRSPDIETVGAIIERLD